MDIQSQTTKPINDDQELAQVLAGVTGNMSFEPIPAPKQSTVAPDPKLSSDLDNISLPTPTIAPMQEVTNKTTKPEINGDLDDIKKEALLMLRPLLDKVNTTPEEKFDIYLLLLRSTDDKSLIDPAYKCAQTIADESRRAQALLDIVREIDFLSNQEKI